MVEDLIYLTSDIEVLVISFGGVGTSFLLREIAKYKKTNSPGDIDFYKHMTIPPLALYGSIVPITAQSQ